MPTASSTGKVGPSFWTNTVARDSGRTFTGTNGDGVTTVLYWWMLRYRLRRRS